MILLIYWNLLIYLLESDTYSAIWHHNYAGMLVSMMEIMILIYCKFIDLLEIFFWNNLFVGIHLLESETYSAIWCHYNAGLLMSGGNPLP